MGAINLIGQTFGRLKVLRQARSDEKGQARWLCECECGNQGIWRGSTLRSGHSRSCGCLREEVSSQTGRKAFKHGGRINNRTTTEYQAWRNILRRCYNTSSKEYKYYGARGIKVSERWWKFENFLADMGHKPSPKHSIDRKNNNGHYEPGNCRWATMEEQQRNRRSNKLLTYAGETLTMKEWAERSGVKYATFKWRIAHGWPIEQAMENCCFR